MLKLKLFSAGWCQPCKMLKKNLGLLKNSNEFELELVDIDLSPEESQKFMVRGIPTLLLLGEDGAETSRTVGNKTISELELFIKGGC